MPDDILNLLVKEGFVTFPTEDDNLIDAERAFFGHRAIQWIKKKTKEDKNFNLHSYLVALTYYKLGLADLKIEDNELLYRYRGNITNERADEYSQVNNESFGEFYRPDQPPITRKKNKSEGTADEQESTEGDE
jgi:hypothetical protein